MQASTSGRLYAGGRLTLDVYYSQTVDTADMMLADVGLAKASTFNGVEVENLATGIEKVTYTYDNGATVSDAVPTTAGKYTVTANFTAADGYLPVEDSLTASVRLVGDDATIAEHGANGFEINYTLWSTTATATDFTAGQNYIFMGMPSYEEAAANDASTGSTIKLGNPVATSSNLTDRNWNQDLIADYDGDNQWFDALEQLAYSWSTNGKFYKNNLVSKTTVESATVYYMDFKLRVENTDNGSAITLYVDHGNHSGTPIWGITSTKQIGAGYAGLNYNGVEGKSYLSDFSVTELTANYKETEETYAVITSTDFEMSYTLSNITTETFAKFQSSGWNYISYNNASDFAVNSSGGGSFYGEYIGLNGAMKAENNSTTPTWTSIVADEQVTKKYTVNKAFENGVTTFNAAPLNAYVIDFDGDGNKEVKFKWTFKNVTENDTTTATITCWLMNSEGVYEQALQVTGMDAITSEAQTVGLYYQNYGFLRKGFISDFKVVCNDAA